MVAEITLDKANNMRKIARTCFRNATVVIDRFHVQKLALEAVQEERVSLRWQAIDEDNRLRKQAWDKGERYEPETLDNGDTRRELLVRSRYLLYKSPDKWSSSEKERAKTLFREYPSIKQSYSLSNSLRQIFNLRSTNASAEQLNSKIKAFRKSLRGVYDLSFFFFRPTKIYA